MTYTWGKGLYLVPTIWLNLPQWRVKASYAVSRPKSIYSPEYLEWRGGQVPLRKDPGPLSKVCIISLSPGLIQRDLQPFNGVTAELGKRKCSDLPRITRHWLWTDTTSWDSKHYYVLSPSGGLQGSSNIHSPAVKITTHEPVDPLDLLGVGLG